MPLFHQPKLVLTLTATPTPTPLMRIDITAPHLRALNPQRQRPAANTRATSRTGVGAAALPKHQPQTPSRAHAGTINGARAKVRFARHLG